MNGHLTPLPLGNLNEIFRQGVFKLSSVIGGWDISFEIALRLISLDSSYKSTMGWCHQETSHYLSRW